MVCFPVNFHEYFPVNTAAMLHYVLRQRGYMPMPDYQITNVTPIDLIACQMRCSAVDEHSKLVVVV